jgi:hypothetical protein
MGCVSGEGSVGTFAIAPDICQIVLQMYFVPKGGLSWLERVFIRLFCCSVVVISDKEQGHQPTMLEAELPYPRQTSQTVTCIFAQSSFLEGSF